jgi:Family of unknown function (DUF5681)
MPKRQPGQSGNPKGRPKKGRTFTDALEAKGTPAELAELAGRPHAMASRELSR